MTRPNNDLADIDRPLHRIRSLRDRTDKVNPRSGPAQRGEEIPAHPMPGHREHFIGWREPPKVSPCITVDRPAGAGHRPQPEALHDLVAVMARAGGMPTILGHAAQKET